ncbi:uL14 family ribosomal protein [Halomonas beimenensis]|uniref:uL14 family ribosomal protein n=1 Tax=Halomonas beimenensis TaxID=475662 RepID=UPI00361ABC25
MIQTQTMLEVADNSGARQVQCSRSGRFTSALCSVGDIIKVTVKEAIPAVGEERPGPESCGRAYRKGVRRPDGS